MASIVLGIGCSHTPQLHTPVEQWEIRAQRDRADDVPLWFHGQRRCYREVQEMRVGENIAAQTAIDIREARQRRALNAIDQLAAVYAACNPDITIIFGNDQRELFFDERRAAFTIMGAPAFVNMPRTEAQISRLPPGIAIADAGHLPEELVQLPGHPALAAHIASYLAARDVDSELLTAQPRPDPAVAPTSGMPHAYGFIYRQVMRDQQTPHVPIDTNTVFAAGVPDVSACHAVGRLVGEAVRDWREDLRICVIASGGLSHFVVDAEFDRDILDAMTRNDYDHLLAYDEGYYQAGSAEIRSWIAAGGALSVDGLAGRIIEYQPLYRTAAGTGSSAAFAVWQ